MKGEGVQAAQSFRVQAASSATARASNSVRNDSEAASCPAVGSPAAGATLKIMPHSAFCQAFGLAIVSLKSHFELLLASMAFCHHDASAAGLSWLAQATVTGVQKLLAGGGLEIGGP